ncbi:MAG TPA: superoxide dismutase [Bacteroidales bacterium]|nr:superoxide dismutase [Bacteroidales bacterium]HRZ48364.1 superoxide dismutase [Bacteroidales bacterium]
MKTLLALLATILLPYTLLAQPFKLDSLPYAYDALAPHLDARTMEIHHTKHHQAYVNNLNKAIAGTPLEKMTLTELMLNISRMGDAIRNNGGGHYNHDLFWKILSPKPALMPKGDLMSAITAQYGTLDSLKREINRAAMGQFGSGWAWLVLTPDRRLAVVSTPNQDNPLMDVAKVHGIPILGIDVWEHAYYLNYQNRRADYLTAVWNVIDWSVVAENYAKALKSPILDMLK